MNDYFSETIHKKSKNILQKKCPSKVRAIHFRCTLLLFTSLPLRFSHLFSPFLHRATNQNRHFLPHCHFSACGICPLLLFHHSFPTPFWVCVKSSERGLLLRVKEKGGKKSKANLTEKERVSRETKG